MPTLFLRRIGKKAEVTMSQILGENKYEHFKHEFGVKGHSFAHGSCNVLEKIIFDKYGRKVDLKDMYEKKIKKIEPRTYFTKEHIIIKDSPGIEKLPEEFHTGKFIPSQLKIWGYEETRYVNKTFAIELNE